MSAAVLPFPGPRPDPVTALRRELSRALEAALDVVDGLVARLDALDGDPDLEPDADGEATVVEWVGAGAHRYNAGLDDHGSAA
ncbi:hypothetical protein SAMN02799636_01111 [Methylobacterium sp. 275MFSha3.1]|uniref:hypothetical protein n=1 Tax=Methylobacterium sp. 275MFSha3.1 TaxID=1502746 RepID=UPI0008A7C2DA|nr:hypothetical protein [Methylobacterium sp. 275MFSha3.1]SEH31650.1 hypothetical protein SAMN02799636_01111 [Methylobacterium sp. 275MFSha3.1]